MPQRLPLWRALVAFLQGNSMTYAAAFAYHALFSFFPLILILLGIGGAFVRTYHLQPHIIESVRSYLPVGSEFVEDNLRTITASSGKISVLAFVLLIWTATGAFMPLELALNQAWGVKKERGFFHKRIVAAVMALLCGYLMLTSVFATIMLGRVEDFLRGFSKDQWVSLTTAVTIEILLVFVSFTLTVVMFALVYKIVPYTHIHFSQVTPTAILAALTWESAKYVFTFFLRYSNYKNVYGSIATIIAILTWVYVSAGILLFFAEYSAQIRTRRKG
jgi:YihY family inner membrane protein